MNNLKNLERLQQLHQLIVKEATGSPPQLARLMQISERKVYQLIEQLKDIEAPVSYSRVHKTYFYEDDFDLQVTVSVTVLKDNELTEIFGGSYFLSNKIQTASFMQGSILS
ncbi:DNA-binding protein [Sinomicrobium pectinilyticum]|uniref:DNA-binding protein n=1 Tax=Sinomicrobium pectinilyticum TaxID=1084421 RepID=A0A3N0EM72_SINP1|nr:DNA-binding protein [Sinomicrobium pectinilyticum]RNL88749.1 DNA-binding protein [Sinomicrobium pectinilyticum]